MHFLGLSDFHETNEIQKNVIVNPSNLDYSRFTFWTWVIFASVFHRAFTIKLLTC